MLKTAHLPTQQNDSYKYLTQGAFRLFCTERNVGKDAVGTMTNPLILTFTGSSINTLFVYYMYALPYIGFINLDFIAVERIKA